MDNHKTDTLVIGAGSVGIAAAYYLKQLQPASSVTLVDSVQPLSFTSAQSGENYRNWWPHPVMKQFMDRSIELMEQIAGLTDNRIQLSGRGYLLATRDVSPQAILDNLSDTYIAPGAIREHTGGSAYADSLHESGNHTVDGVDILSSPTLIQNQYPYLDKDLQCIVHIRKGGQLSTQQLGSYMLEVFKEQGGQLLVGEVRSIQRDDHFAVQIDISDGTKTVDSTVVVNAAGPFASRVSKLLLIDLPVFNVLQQKIAFEDTKGVIDRTMPFAIDLDPQRINWTDDEREALAGDPSLAWLLGEMPGSMHCRAEGSNWMKLGWAYNNTYAEAVRQPVLDDYFPEIVLRGASRLHPALSAYFNAFPRSFSHYGGYYTMTEENWPLLGETDISGFYIATAMSGFGSMAACAAGELVAKQVLGQALPGYGAGMSLQRYNNSPLMKEISALQSRGIL